LISWFIGLLLLVSWFIGLLVYCFIVLEKKKKQQKKNSTVNYIVFILFKIITVKQKSNVKYFHLCKIFIVILVDYIRFCFVYNYHIIVV